MSMKSYLFLIALVSTSAFLSYFAQQAFTSLNTACALSSYLQTHDEIEARWFWEWRDKNNGFYTFDKNVVSPGMTHRFDSGNSETWMLETYTASNISSTDYVAPPLAESSLLSAIQAISHQEILNQSLKQGSNYSLSTSTTPGEITLEVTFTTEDLVHTNGLFDFLPEERNQLKEKVWKSISHVKIPPLARYVCQKPFFDSMH